MLLPLTPLRFLERAATEYGRKIGVVCGAERFTYAQHAQRVYRLAGALRARGIAFVRRYSGGAEILAACGMLASTAGLDSVAKRATRTVACM